MDDYGYSLNTGLQCTGFLEFKYEAKCSEIRAVLQYCHHHHPTVTSNVS